MKIKHLASIPLVVAAAALFACGPLDRDGSASDRASAVEGGAFAGEDCTLTQGYWKNHEEAWPVSGLTIGGVQYDAAELLDLLRTPTKGDASLILGHQLIAARLNVENGAGAPPDVAAALADADAWMAANIDADGRLAYGVRGGAASEEGVALSEILAMFNEGAIGPGHCDDTTGSGGGTTGSGGGTTGSGGGTTGSGGSTGTGNPDCPSVCGEGTSGACGPDYDCIDGCCLPIIY